jgi:tetratricopeptide (TPR) repeat protein
MGGDNSLESSNFAEALKAYLDAQTAYYEVYRAAETHGGLVVSEILANKVSLTEKYIAQDNLVKMGEMFEIEELYPEALTRYREAEQIVKTIDDLDLRKEVMTRIFEAERKMNSESEVKFVRQIQALMTKAEEDLNYGLALQYAEFILDVYRGLGIDNQQAKDDKIRIEAKMEWDKQANDYLQAARSAAAGTRYESAINNYEEALKLYEKMDIGFWHERYRGIMTEIEEVARIKSALEETEPVAEVPIIE